MNHYTLDLETVALPKETLLAIMPAFEAASNIKDEAKIAADIAKKQEAWLESAALEAHRSSLLAIGILHEGEAMIWHGEDEALMLRGLRDFAIKYHDKIVIGHNLLGFDLVYAVRRMWKHGIQPPSAWLDCTPWKAKFAYDTCHEWGCGNRDKISLDMLAWHLLGQRKTGSGADFAALYATDKEAAIAYLNQDLRLTEECYRKMTKWEEVTQLWTESAPKAKKAAKQKLQEVEDIIP